MDSPLADLRSAVEDAAAALANGDGRARQPPRHVLVLAHHDQLEPRVAREQLLVVLHVVGVGRPEAADG